MKKILVAVLLSVGLIGGMNAYAAGDAAAGEARYAACIGCHGPGGNSLNPMWPKLAGQNPLYIRLQLEAFKTGKRKDPIMAPMALAVDEKAILDLAAYFASVKRSAGVSNPEQVKKGELIYINGFPQRGVLACGACHGADGYGNPGAGFPNIASQQALYLVKMLKDYRAKTRTTDPGEVMQNVAANLTDAEIDQLAQYAQSLAP
ncbi:MAG: cytochrome c4 [Candidatus Polarisedimenticolaceae bacterium]|nr:cytochrome c4 [Candidatus Polarisedimenticolaceae bacterium]